MQRKKHRWWMLPAGVGALLVAATVAIALGQGDGDNREQRRASEPSASATEQPSTESALRTLVVTAGDRRPSPSRPGRALHARLVGGAAPSSPTMATVLADEDCAPNAKGVSNCLNRLRLADGRHVSVRHPHRMSEVPCLSPGERVNFRPA
jgi:hypothetical protein